MSNVLRLAIVDPNDNSRTQLKNMLLGMDIVWLEAECSRYEFFADVIGQTKPDIGVIAIDSNPEKGLKLLEQVREIAPDCCAARRQHLDRRPDDPEGDAERGQGVPHAADQGRRPDRGARPDQRRQVRHRRRPRPHLPRDRRLRRDGRRRLDQPGGQPGLHPGPRRAEQRRARRSRHGPRRRRRLPRHAFPTTRWSMSRRTSRGSTSRCSSGRSPSTPRACTCCRGPCNCKTRRTSRPTT